MEIYLEKWYVWNNLFEDKINLCKIYFSFLKFFYRVVKFRYIDFDMFYLNFCFYFCID